MKKILLSACIVGVSASAMAQVTLTGSSYTQDFNGIGSGVPTGWRVYNGSSATTLGTLESLITSTSSGVFNDTACGSNNVTGGGFKNYPSANAVTEGTSCTAQQSTADRALGVRQVSKTNATHPNLDSGAAFVFVINNTTGLDGFDLSFKLQSLDTSSPRTTTWIVDYAVGTTTSFTPITTSPASLTTGGHAFSNTPVTVDFGTALDNKSGNVYIRIVTLEASTGTGNRASTAIDDFTLTYHNPVGVANVNNAGELPFSVLGAASASQINFSIAPETAGNYNLVICDLTGRQVYSESVTLQNGAQTHTVNGNFAAGMYIARLSNGQTAGVAKVVVQ